MDSYISVLKNYATFSGRESRRTFWKFIIIHLIIILCLTGLDYMKNTYYVRLYSLMVFLPFLGVIVRRLHDIGKSGFNYLFILIPIIGQLYLVFLLSKKGEEKDNKYGRYCCG